MLATCLPPNGDNNAAAAEAVAIPLNVEDFRCDTMPIVSRSLAPLNDRRPFSTAPNKRAWYVFPS